MTTNRLVYELPDGWLPLQLSQGAIVYWWVDPRSKFRRDDEQGWLEAIHQRLIAANPMLDGATRLPNCDAADLPGKRFRDCWRNDGTGKIHVDMPLARAQRMAEIRAERDKRLAVTDADKNKLDDIGTAQQKTALATKRQALRDIPQNSDLEAVTTPEALEAFEPAWPG